MKILMLTPARVSLVATAVMVALEDPSNFVLLGFVTELAMYTPRGRHEKGTLS